MNRLSRSCCVVLLAGGLGAPPASAATLDWPAVAPAPCAGLTLQNCIAVAAPGDVVQVVTNNPITQDLTIDKSLTLCAGSGYAPLLDALHYVFLNNPATSTNTIVFRDFTLTRGRVFAVQNSTLGCSFTITNLTIQDTFNDGPVVQVRTGQSGIYGHVQFEVSDNLLTVPAGSQFSGAEVISIEGGQATAMTGSVRGNRIDHFDGGQNSAIGLYNFHANPLHIDVIANEIRGSDYNSGVNFFQFGAGNAQIRYLDNLVVGQTSVAGAPGAYVINVIDGSATFEITNNTAAAGDNGIMVTGYDDLGASWSGTVANNIVAGMSGGGLSLSQPTQTSGTVDNDHNLVYNVGHNSFTPGPGTLTVDPLFVGGSDYHLTELSPARDAGNSARVPSDLVTDLEGNSREVAAVDIGAYELPCTAPLATWGTCGATLGSSTTPFSTPVAVSDGTCGTFVGWKDPEIRLNRVTVEGLLAPGWPPVGVLVSGDSVVSGTSVCLVPDGSGGVFVVWDFSGTTHCQRMTASGNPAPGWPAGGIAVPGLQGDYIGSHGHRAAADGGGGLFIVSQYRMQHLDGNGNLASGWSPSGLSFSTGIETIIAASSGGGVFAATELSMSRVAGDGTLAWQVNLPLAFWSRLVATDDGGVFAASDGYGGGPVLLRRLLGNGNNFPGWPAGGVAVSASGALIDAKDDGNGGVFVTWRESGPPSKIALQRIAANGTIVSGWPANGFRIGPASQEQLSAAAASDGTGGAFLYWQAKVGTTARAYCGARVSANGALAPNWPADGAEVCPNIRWYGTGSPWIFADGAGGAFATGFRRTAATGWGGTIHVLRFAADPPASSMSTVAAGSPSIAAVGNVTVTFASVTTGGPLNLGLTTGPEPPSGQVTVPANTIYELSTGAEYSGGIDVCIDYDPGDVSGSESALRLLHFEGVSDVPEWIDITTSVDVNANRICGHTTSLSPFAIVESDATGAAVPAAALRLEQNTPNPFNPATFIAYELPAAGRVRLRIFDVRGRLVRTLVDGARDAGAYRALWRGEDEDARRCSSGVYFYRLETDQGVLSRRMVLAR